MRSITKLAIFIVVFSLISVSMSAMAQDDADACDTSVLSASLTNYAESMDGKSYEAVVDIAADMTTLITDYQTNCGEAADTETSTTETGEALFNVIASGNVNIRSCSDTTCDIVSISENGQVYAVLAEDGDWYEIDLGEGETGFIASWLTARGPDDLIDIYEGYLDEETDCYVVANVSRSTSNDLNFIITGDAMRDVVVDIYRPNKTTPETVWRQYDKAFIDTGDPYIHQFYRSSYWPKGLYQVSLKMDNAEKVYGFNLTESGETSIYVICD